MAALSPLHVGLFLFLIAGGLFPIRPSRRRSSFHLRNSTALAAFVILGPSSLALIVAAALVSAAILLTVARLPPDTRLRRLFLPEESTVAGEVGRLLRDTAFFFVSLPLTAWAYSRTGTGIYPMPLGRPGELANFLGCTTVASGIVALGSEAYYRFLSAPAPFPSQGVRKPGLLPSDAPLYWLLLVVGSPLQLVTHVLYLSYGPALMLASLAWFVLLTVLHNALLRRRNQLLQAVRELEISQRIVAEGEIAGRIVHQTRHQLGLIGIGTHLIREALKQPTGSRRRILVELDRLDEVASVLKRVLSEELEPREVVEAETPDTSTQGGHLLSLGALVQDELERLQGKAEQLGIQLVLEAATDGVVRGTELEAEQLGQGLFNVIDNALGAASNRVTVFLNRRLDGYAIRVVDDGPGIDRELLPRVAEPFVSTKAAGSGMGLYIATAAARRWGGELQLQNIPEGGLRATFWLPSKR